MTKEEFIDDVDILELKTEDFYNLCQKFADVGLNSLKIKGEDGNLQGNFLESDILNASNELKLFLTKTKINPAELLSAIHRYVYKSVSDDDKREKAVFVRNDKTDFSGAYYAGTIYTFTDLPQNIMEIIFNKAGVSLK